MRKAIIALLAALMLLAGCGNNEAVTIDNSEMTEIAEVPSPSPAVSAPTPTPTIVPTPEVTPTPTLSPTLTPTPTPMPTPTPTPTSIEEAESKQYCTLSVSCESVLTNKNLTDNIRAVIPENGIIFAAAEVEIAEGESVFDVLLRIMREHGIHIEFSKTPAYNSVYIEGIGNLYQMDCGDMSGWLYRVNGEIPDKGSSEVYVEDGDRIEWLYSCNFGADIR